LEFVIYPSQSDGQVLLFGIWNLGFKFHAAMQSCISCFFS
jgi:hypothetical protein